MVVAWRGSGIREGRNYSIARSCVYMSALGIKCTFRFVRAGVVMVLGGEPIVLSVAVCTCIIDGREKGKKKKERKKYISFWTCAYRTIMISCFHSGDRKWLSGFFPFSARGVRGSFYCLRVISFSRIRPRIRSVSYTSENM